MEGTSKLKQTVRLSIITSLVTIFAGLLVYSIGYVRYKVNGKPTTELTITKLSLTHCVERQDGKLVNPYEAKVKPALDLQPYMVASTAGVAPPKKAAAKTTSNKATVKKPAAKKPASNKATVNKPAAKNSTPKKRASNKKATPKKKSAPSKKAAPKKAAPKACPT